jgi:acetyl-CoA carboxylase biotin carboxyl carrier protein
VPDDVPLQPRPFDIPMIHALIELMSRNDLNEVDLCEGDKRIRLRRGAKTIALTSSLPATPQLATQASPAAPVSAPAERPSKPLQEIKSQLVGTFYSAGKPGTPSFVKVGDRVTPTTVVGIIEAMKIFNEITAECSGVITEICVENQQPVEFEQVLFRVDPSA